MATVTFRVLEGLECGRVYSSLSTPVTIGREDENDIQLNDDRVSRFHVKIQDDAGRMILTDLDSTNGTRVNGHPVQMKVLQDGDLVSIGRCVLLFGDMPGWTPSAESSASAIKQTAVFDENATGNNAQDLDFLGLATNDQPDPLFPKGAPPVPQELRPLQRAQVSDVLAYLHDQIGRVLAIAKEQEEAGNSRQMVCPREAWNELLSMQATLASYLRKIADPD